jgi:hypothetical protein
MVAPHPLPLLTKRVCPAEFYISTSFTVLHLLGIQTVVTLDNAILGLWLISPGWEWYRTHRYFASGIDGAEKLFAGFPVFPQQRQPIGNSEPQSSSPLEPGGKLCQV